MADEQLRLVASLKDNVSAGVRAIGKQLKTVRVEPGMQQAQKWIRGFNDDVAQFKKGGLTIANVMSSMGVGGLAAAGSIGALAAQFKQLADHVLDVKELGREIGVTTDQLRAMERAGQHFGFDPAAMEGALKRLAGLMPIFRRGGNNELTQALARSPELIAKIRSEADDTAAVFKDIMGYVGKLTNPQDRVKFYEQIFGNGDLEKLNAEGVGGFDKQVEVARRALGPITREAEAQAQALRDAIIDFNAAVEKLELKVAPTVFKGMKQAADDFRQAFGVIEEAYNWYRSNKEHPVEAAGKSFADAVHERRQENERNPNGIVFDAPGALDRALETVVGKKALGRDEFAPAKDDADKTARLAAMQKELDTVAAKLAADHNPVSFATREASAIARVRELRDAIGTLRGLSPVPPIVPSVAPLPPPRPPAPAFRVPSRYDAEGRARGLDDGKDHSLDSFVVGALEKPILHLSGTLKTAAAQAEADGIHPAAFHPVGLIGPAGANDPVSMLAAGVKQGMLEAMREWAGGAGSADGSTARSGIMPASFGGGGGGGGGNSALGGGSFGGSGKSAGGMTAASKDLVPEARALLDTLASGEAPDYNVMNGGARFSDYSHHPGGRAAGRYQFLPSTWRRVQAALALKDFSPESQDKGALWLAQQDFTKRTGRDLMAELGSKDPARIAAVGRALHSTWISLGGGFGGKYQGYLSRQFGVSGVAGKTSGVNPVLTDMVKRASEILGTNLSVYSGVRSPEHNRAVGGAENSLHMRGLAADLQAAGHSKADRPFWEQVNRAMAQAAAEFHQPYRWGGTFGGRYHDDNDHFDLTGAGASPEALARHQAIMEKQTAPIRKAGEELRAAAQDQQRAAGEQGHAATTLGNARRLLRWFNKGSKVDDPADTPITTRDMRDPKFAPPGWHDPNRPDLDREKRRVDADRQAARVEGGIDAHIHVHDGQVRSARAAGSGHVRDARITVRSAPQRTVTV